MEGLYIGLIWLRIGFLMPGCW